ncbi:Gfo/Idh/MocA family protein [Microlunatus parietis]|uniref:Putative dehydrogenase n=1 Tax=Microlunatus parietis TaxID=682979 RepID=A0A7Y9I5I3_9ACTN|nr:Gfo/Idh/MocA family oxidoreductase [Microlunatus parietis]NYE70478.1 putative dehydrogenase [Microlunatus parietis]
MTDHPRYALCGLSNRAIGTFVGALLDSVVPGRPDVERAPGELVAILDADRDRVDQFLAQQENPAIAAYGADEFDRMITEARPDRVIIATPDHSHADYVVAALGHGLDVITEKPMTATAADAARVLAAERDSAGTVTVTHNVRYTPRLQQVKRLIMDGAIGRVLGATLDYHVDTRHGASYFLRWNRTRAASGGLSVHKSCHHLDLVDWLVDDLPVTVYARGGRAFYGPDSPHRPRDEHGAPLTGDWLRAADPYQRAQQGSGTFPDDDHGRTGLAGLSYPVQYPDGQPFTLYDDEIDIEDHYTAVIGYRGGATLAYTIDFSSPWEGYRLGITGSHGRIELDYGHDRDGSPRPGTDQVIVDPLFGERRRLEAAAAQGGHDGADAIMRRDLFVGPTEESRRLGLAATTEQAAYAVAAGEAIWRSARSGSVINIADLLGHDVP